jgi:hypothetical protein
MNPKNITALPTYEIGDITGKGGLAGFRITRLKTPVVAGPVGKIFVVAEGSLLQRVD